ncbi:hypothetical protein HK104_002798, partial [Borealophlyctis nickersoniae]
TAKPSTTPPSRAHTAHLQGTLFESQKLYDGRSSTPSSERDPAVRREACEWFEKGQEECEGCGGGEDEVGRDAVLEQERGWYCSFLSEEVKREVEKYRKEDGGGGGRRKSS